MQGLSPFQIVFFQTVHCFSVKRAVLTWCVSSSRQTRGKDAPMPGRRATRRVDSHLRAAQPTAMRMTTALNARLCASKAPGNALGVLVPSRTRNTGLKTGGGGKRSANTAPEIWGCFDPIPQEIQVHWCCESTDSFVSSERKETCRRDKLSPL